MKWSARAAAAIVVVGLAVTGLPAGAAAAPGAPRRLEATVAPSTGAVTLRWRPPAGDVGVVVYAWYGGDQTRYGPFPATSTRSHRTTCDLSRGCSYVVAAVDATGESAPSNRVFVGGEVPGPPTGLVATPDPATGSVGLAWSLPAGGPPVNEVVVYAWFGSDPHRYGPYAATSTTAHVTSCDLRAGCSYAVAARNAAGESMPSNRVFVGGEVPRAPTGLAATPDPATGDVALSWSLAAGGPPATAVVLYAWRGGDATRYGPFSTDAVTSHTDSCDLRSGCSFAVAAWNAAGESPLTGRVSVGGEVPAPPGFATATVVDHATGEVRLSWAAPAGATSYAYYSWVGGNPTRFGPFSTSGATTHTTSCDLEVGCSYAVVAFNAAGESAESARAHVGSPEAAGPVPVGGATVTASGRATVTLSPVGSAVRWERRVGGGQWGATSSPATCPDPAAGCQFRAFGIGNLDDAEAGPFPLDVHAPGRPRRVAAVRSEGEVQAVSWAPPVDSGGFDVAAYAVERSLDAWPQPATGWEEVARVDGDERGVEVVCPGLEQGVACRLRVVAHTLAGASAPATALCGEPDPSAVDLAPSCRPPVRLDAGSWDRFAAEWAATPGLTPVPGGAVAALEQAAPGDRLVDAGACDGWGGVEVPSHDGWCWPEPEQGDPLWYPQGVAVNAEVGGWWTGRRLAAVSWYRRTDPDGADTDDRNRVTLVDTVNRLFTHLTLVEPTGCPGACRLAPVAIHAGGIAQVGRWLYVVDTSVGFRVFDLDAAARARVPDGSSSPIEVVLPQVAEYRMTSGDLRFSSVDVDEAMAGEGGIGSLVVTEYLSGRPGARTVRFPIGVDGRLVTGAGGEVRSLATEVATDGEIRNLQGGAVCSGHRLANRSRGSEPGLMFDLELNGTATSTGWLVGPEDLACDRSAVWALGEHPGERMLARVALTAIG